MSQSVRELIGEYLQEGPYAVVGASTDREKYGNKVLRAYVEKGMEVFPINPKADEVEGLPAYASLDALPQPVRGISVITPPKITEMVVEEAARTGVSYVWIQPGAESPAAVRRAGELGLKVIADGSCFLVEVGSSLR
jgi:predicted CoA-binding protein